MQEPIPDCRFTTKLLKIPYSLSSQENKPYKWFQLSCSVENIFEKDQQSKQISEVSFLQWSTLRIIKRNIFCQAQFKFEISIEIELNGISFQLFQPAGRLE